MNIRYRGIYEINAKSQKIRISKILIMSVIFGYSIDDPRYCEKLIKSRKNRRH